MTTGLLNPLTQLLRPALDEHSEWAWLRVFDKEDFHEFVHEMYEALAIASREESSLPVEETLYRWHAAAQALADPTERAILLGKHSDEDFVEVQRPE